MANIKLKAIDFFCSGGGMSYGLLQAGINVVAGIDNDLRCKSTYEANIKNAKFIHTDITLLKETKLKELVEVKKNDDSMIFIGCSPCQFWTLINTTKTKSKKSKNLLLDFQRFVLYYNPGFVIVENVPGILSRKNESGLDDFILNLEQKGYKLDYRKINMNHFGVPQNRIRFSLIATRVSDKPIFPKSEISYFPVVKDFIGEQNGFPKVEAGYKDNSEFMHTVSNLSTKNLERLKKTRKNGGSRLDWANTNLQLNTYKKIDKTAFIDTYGRMSWNKPAPTITTKFNSISNGRFGHPDENRAISIREGATLQTFPKDFIFKTESILTAARIIGNAVPPEFAKRIGKSLLEVE